MSTFPLKIRCVTQSGSFIISTLTDQSTVEELLTRISTRTGINQRHMRILARYPPTPITFPDRHTTLSTMGFRSGDTIHVEESLSLPSLSSISTAPSISSQPRGILMKHVVPADNSCLFNSIAYALTGQNFSPNAANEMREIIAATVSSEPTTYISAILDNRTNDQYCAWILKDTSWGGAVEISILSKYHSVEVVVVDSQSGTLARFGEDRDYTQRILLLYDGIHYDPLVLMSPTKDETIQTIFPAAEESILFSALDIAKEAQSARQFVNVNRLPMMCLVCRTEFLGPQEAQQHAQESGHSNFAEVDMTKRSLTQ